MGGSVNIGARNIADGYRPHARCEHRTSPRYRFASSAYGQWSAWLSGLGRCSVDAILAKLSIRHGSAPSSCATPAPVSRLSGQGPCNPTTGCSTCLSAGVPLMRMPGGEPWPRMCRNPCLRRRLLCDMPELHADRVPVPLLQAPGRCSLVGGSCGRHGHVRPAVVSRRAAAKMDLQPPCWVHDAYYQSSRPASERDGPGH